jgi:ABC-type dipeptide/oligopeptide/nickel transport system ATPase component
MNYQVKVWNDYSIQIEDYVKLGIVQDMGSGKSNSIVEMIDPYSYRKKLTMPKMIFMGTNDEYWPIDNIKNPSKWITEIYIPVFPKAIVPKVIAPFVPAATTTIIEHEVSKPEPTENP